MYTRIHSPGLHLEGDNTCTHGYILLGYIWRVATHVHTDTFSWATSGGWQHMYTRIHSPGLHLEGDNTCTHGYILLGYIWRVTTHVHTDTFSWATSGG